MTLQYWSFSNAIDDATYFMLLHFWNGSHHRFGDLFMDCLSVIRLIFFLNLYSQLLVYTKIGIPHHDKRPAKNRARRQSERIYNSPKNPIFVSFCYKCWNIKSDLIDLYFVFYDHLTLTSATRRRYRSSRSDMTLWDLLNFPAFRAHLENRQSGPIKLYESTCSHKYANCPQIEQ